MNSTKNLLTQRLLPLSMMAVIMIFFWSCGQAGQNKAREAQLEEVKQTVEQDLRTLQNDIQQRLDYLDEEIEQTSGETEESLRSARQDLQQQSDRLEEEMEAVKEASLDSWDEVVANVSRVATDVRTRTNEITKKVREVMDEELEQ
ncbi:MAG: hypothetical protein R6U64_06695 [Bacteroidales bacterium]